MDIKFTEEGLKKFSAAIAQRDHLAGSLVKAYYDGGQLKVGAFDVVDDATVLTCACLFAEKGKLTTPEGDPKKEILNKIIEDVIMGTRFTFIHLNEGITEKDAEALEFVTLEFAGENEKVRFFNAEAGDPLIPVIHVLSPEGKRIGFVAPGSVMRVFHASDLLRWRIFKTKELEKGMFVLVSMEEIEVRDKIREEVSKNKPDEEVDVIE